MNNAILADPTNFGNKPGDGPLRVGGEEKAGLPVADGDRPDTRSPAAQKQVAAVRICRDLWEGNEAMRRASGEYLPQAPGETPSAHASRVERSVFFNAFRQTIVGLTGLIFRKDPVLGDDVPKLFADEHWENIDNAGTHGDLFVKDITEDALQAGHAAILVEFPKVEVVLNREAESRVRPYWVPIKKEDILSWRTTVVSGKTQLAQIVIQLQQWVASGRFGEKLRTRYLVIAQDVAKGAAPTWEVLEVLPNKAVATIDKGVYANQTQIPLAEVVTSGRRSMFDSQPPLLDLAFLNLAHYRTWSDYETSIHKTCVPVLVLTGVNQSVDENGQPVGGIVVGPNTVLTLSAPEARAAYVSHNGESLDSVKQALDDLKSDMGAFGLSMLAPQKRTAETAEAKRLDKATTDSALGVVARGVQDAVELAMQFHANYLGEESGGSVTINRDFEGLLMDAPVMQAYVALRNAGFPPRIILKELQDGGRIPEDEDVEALALEMEANRASAEEAERMEEEADSLRLEA